MSDGERPVLCRVSHEALRDLANRVHFDGTDENVFEAYRELIEQVAAILRMWNAGCRGPLPIPADHGGIVRLAYSCTPSALAVSPRILSSHCLFGL